MSEKGQDNSTYRPAGYAALIERYNLDLIPNWHRSFVAITSTHRIDSTGGVIEEVYPSKYCPGDMPDRMIGLFIRFCLQNNGRLSPRKRIGRFDSLTDEEIARMEQAIQMAYGSKTANDG